MTLSQLIANDKQCREDAKAFTANNYDELFQNAWLRVYDYELKHETNTDNHRSFFFSMLRNVFIDGKKKKKLTLTNIDNIEIQSIESAPNYYQTYLDIWLNEDATDEMDLFYKNIINLVLISGKVKDACELSLMGKTKFNHYLQEAKQKLKDDFDKFTDTSDIHNLDMV